MLAQFVSHGHCYLWKTDLIELHVLSDLLIAISYFSIPITIIYYVQQRKDLPYAFTFILFGAFIVSCGTSHLIEIWTVWQPVYWISGVVKAITALISLYTAMEIWAIVPLALNLPSATELQLVNQKLEQEISERKQIEAELKQEKKLVKTMLDNLSDGIVACDENGILNLFNRAAEEFHGLQQEAIAAECWSEHYDLYHADGKTMMSPKDVPLFRALNGESVKNVKMAIVPKRGQPRYLIVNGDPIIDDEGKKLGAIAALRDVTERDRTRRNLQQIESTIASFYSSAPMMMGIVELLGCEDLRHISGNNMAADFFNMTSDREIANKQGTKLNISSKVKHILIDACLQSQIKDRPIEFEFFREVDEVTKYFFAVVSVLEKQSLTERSLFSYIIQDISDRKIAEMELTKSLKEKEILLQEIHHRVKNNLQVICSLLNLQSRYLKEEKIIKAFKETQNRVKAMALVHQQLYQSVNLSEIVLSSYIRQLVGNLSRAYSITSKIEYHFEFVDFKLDLDTAVPCGLIVNEVVTNAIKYAFPENQQGKISIYARANSDNYLSLTIEDNGIGLMPNYSSKTNNSLGLRLVENLTEQLQGKVEIISSQSSGTKFKFVFNRIKRAVL